MNLPIFKPKKAVNSLLNSNCKNTFYVLMGQRLRNGRGKSYKNFEKKLPIGHYQELEVNGPQDSRRIIVDTSNFDIYATRNHYETICYAGRPEWAEEKS